MCYLEPVSRWEVEGKEQEPVIERKILKKFAPKYIKELVSEGFDIIELFDEKTKAFIPKEKFEAVLNQKRFEKIQKAIEDKFVKNLGKLERLKTKEELEKKFPNLWKKKKKFDEHVNKRVAKGHIPKENANIQYIKSIIGTLANHDKILMEKGKKSQIIYVLSKENWVVIVNKNGKIETAFYVDIGLQNWINDRILKGNEVKENVYSRTIKEACKKLWDRFRLL